MKEPTIQDVMKAINALDKKLDSIVSRLPEKKTKKNRLILKEPQLKTIAKLRLKGIAVSTIARQLAVNPVTIYRHNAEIKAIMQQIEHRQKAQADQDKPEEEE